MLTLRRVRPGFWTDFDDNGARPGGAEGVGLPNGTAAGISAVAIVGGFEAVRRRRDVATSRRDSPDDVIRCNKVVFVDVSAIGIYSLRRV